MSATDRFSGEPLIILTQAGVDQSWSGGQPLMDQGLCNQAILSLFTRKGWVGNQFLPLESQIGSDFEKACEEEAITLASITATIPNAALAALSCDYFKNITVAVANPNAWNLTITIHLGSGQTLLLSKSGLKWAAQANQNLTEES
jgi:hypothetical protein